MKLKRIFGYLLFGSPIWAMFIVVAYRDGFLSALCGTLVLSAIVGGTIAGIFILYD